jgi:RNA polymerase sigma-70 factor (ECF subfamily)
MTSDRSPSATIQDAQLIREIVNGKKDLFSRLVDRYHGLVRMVIWNFFHQAPEIDDFCQEAFLKAFLNLGSLDDPQRFKKWLLKIACRVCLDARRKKNPQESLFHEIPEGMLPEDHTAQKPFKEMEMKNLLEILAPGDRLIVWFKYVEGYGYDEIAAMIQASEPAVRQRASRAMKVLRERLSR